MVARRFVFFPKTQLLDASFCRVGRHEDTRAACIGGLNISPLSGTHGDNLFSDKCCRNSRKLVLSRTTTASRGEKGRWWEDGDIKTPPSVRSCVNSLWVRRKSNQPSASMQHVGPVILLYIVPQSPYMSIAIADTESYSRSATHISRPPRREILYVWN